jgi:hypothetical protein
MMATFGLQIVAPMAETMIKAVCGFVTERAMVVQVCLQECPTTKEEAKTN